MIPRISDPKGDRQATPPQPLLDEHVCDLACARAEPTDDSRHGTTLLELRPSGAPRVYAADGLSHRERSRRVRALNDRRSLCSLMLHGGAHVHCPDLPTRFD
jgi:hypothetical protein